MKSLADVAADFDEIAAALTAGPVNDRLTPAERSLLGHVPLNARRALDVGCGDGVLSRALAARGLDIVGIDVSPGMVELARARTKHDASIEYRVADILTAEVPAASFDVVLAVSVVHHVPLDVIIPRLVELVAWGGVLLVQDVEIRPGVWNLPINATALAVRRVRQLVTPVRMTRRVAAAYAAHGANERYLAADEVEAAYRPLLANAHVQHHLEWRYTVVWRRPPA